MVIGSHFPLIIIGRNTVKNAGYNANIAPGQTISFGLKGSGGVHSDAPSNFYLYSYDLFFWSFSDVVTVPYDTATGIIQEADYRRYVEKRYQSQYWIPETDIDYATGLHPSKMIWGIRRFLEFNGSSLNNVEWAPYCLWRKKDQKEAVLDRIRLMLKNNIPVVFSYYHPNKRIILYSTLDNLKTNNEDKAQYPDGHYMTIVGLYKYLMDSPDSELHYEYVLEVVSWGTKYYIKYDDYADNLNYFSNILSAH